MPWVANNCCCSDYGLEKMTSSTLRKFCVFYNVRDDSENRAKLIFWLGRYGGLMEYGSTRDNLEVDVRNEIYKFNSDPNNKEKIDGAEARSLTAKIRKAFKLE